MEPLFQAAGWAGTLLVVIAYFLVSTNRISASSRRYQILNLLGAVGVGINVFHQGAWPALALQIIWGLIAILSLVRARTAA